MTGDLNPDLREKYFKGKPERNYPSDEKLWRLFKEGDEGAFVTIYNQYIDKLYQIGIQFTSDSDAIKDYLQDFFINIRDRKEKLSNTDNIRLYLFKAFRRKVFHELKKKKRFASIANQKESTFPVEFSIEEKIINAHFDEFQLKKLNQALEKLPVKEREAIFYFYFQNLSYKEIADMLHYDHISSARRLIYKSLDKLRKLFLIISGFYLYDLLKN